MSYAPFYDRFPELAEKETRVLIALNHPDLPPDEYGLLESYCDEQGCDCRRVFLNVASMKRNKILAVIAYGWESKRFYAKWFGQNDPEVINELQGPALNLSSHQSKLAPALLREVKNVILQDQNYINRLKRHYQMFKDAVDNEPNEEEARITSPKRIARNDPCPCGSGKKYKHCCGR